MRRLIIIALTFIALPAIVFAESSKQCSADSGHIPPQPFDVGDSNDYGGRILELTPDVVIAVIAKIEWQFGID